MNLDDEKIVQINIEELEKISAFIKETSMGKTPTVIETNEIENKYLKEMYENIQLLYDYIGQMSDYSLAISHGDLSVDFPPRKNYLASGLKELHSNMLHLIWKVKQVSSGKYNQKIESLGQISDAFNQMLDCLKTRDNEINQLRDVVNVLFLHSNIMIFVINIETEEVIFSQHENKTVCSDDECKIMSKKLTDKLNKKVREDNQESSEWELYFDANKTWYNVNSLFTTWNNNQKVYFHMLIDISSQKKKIDTLKAQVSKDPMTLAFNQGYAMEKVKKLIVVENDFSICFMDIDGLKTANDVYGHDTGDKLIMHFVEIVNYVTRGQDYFCRLGGDEFLLISQNTPNEVMKGILERIEINVKAFNELEIIPIVLSFSYGIETYDREIHKDSKAMISMADKNMYIQKRFKYSEKAAAVK